MKILIIILSLSLISQKVNSQVDNQFQMNIYKNIRCLVCQGQSIADSNSDFAQTIKLVIDDKIKEGKNEDEIYEFLISKYGEWIVYRPELKKTNFFLWFFPYIALLLGGILILSLFRKKNLKNKK
mgnify:CR=1 FL=1|tara:strand:- start:8202 stop:8576 length:375 start_codon:yes stop_codon:yes gene_type:complete